MRGIALISGILVSVAAHAGGFNFTFDSGAEGWTKGDFGNSFATMITGTTAATWSGGGESGGYIAGTDHGSYAFHYSPNLGGNHGDLFGETLSFDFQSAGTGANDPFLVLLSSNSFLVAERVVSAGTSFTNWQFTLDSSSSFYFNSSTYNNGGSAVLATDSQIQSVLSDLQYIGVSTDITNGGDTTRLDNVQAVPEPATMTILAAAGLAAVARKKRK